MLLTLKFPILYKLRDPDEGHKPKCFGLNNKVALDIPQVLLEFWPLYSE